MGVGVLGTLTVDGAAVSLGPRDRVVLAALATRPGQVVGRDGLAEALWREEPPASAVKVLQGCVVRLRRVLGQDAIETTPEGYRLVVAGEELDAVRFENGVGRARDLLTLGQADRAAHVVADALDLWRGRPFTDLEDWGPGIVEAARLEDLRREAEELRVDALLRAGRPCDVLADAAALVREAPTREQRWGLLARAQYQVGRQGEALGTLQQARGLLAQRLGLDPGPELAELEARILRQDPDLLPATTTRSDDRCPYRGLAAYDVTDADTFFGREPELRACLAMVQATGVLAVVGPSGSGKSSLVRAGVASALARRGVRVHVVTPGEHPTAALDRVETHRGDALVVDQCEEVFTACDDVDERREFLDRVVAHVDCGPLVVALRADRLTDVASFPSFSRFVERGLHLLGDLDEDALRVVVEEPARQAGLILEPGLVDLLVREVQGQPGALPLLSHALQETWARREGRTLTVAGYQATGGIRGAVAQTAEQVYAGVDAADRHLLRELMLRLVSAGEQGEASRLRVPRSRVVVEPAQERLVEELVAARLVTSEEGVIEITHESLTRAWPRLQAWLDEDVEGRRILHHLAAAADAWDALGRPDSELYRGARLQQAREWRDSSGLDLAPVERDFLDAGQAAAAREEEELAERARRQARLIRRQRLALAGGAVFLALALATGGLAVGQADRARKSERAAEASRGTAEALAVGARALTVDDPSLSLLLAVEGVEREDSARTRDYLRRAMALRPELVTSTDSPPVLLGRLAVHPDGRHVATYDIDNVVHAYDVESGARVASFDMDGPGATHRSTFPSGVIAFSPGGEYLAVGAQLWSSPSLRVLDADTLEPHPVEGRLRDIPEDAKAMEVDFSADERWFAAAVNYVADPTAPTTVLDLRAETLVWDLRHPDRPPRRFDLPDPNLRLTYNRIRISDDGRTVYAGSPPAAYDVDSGEALWARPRYWSPGGPPIDLSPDGTAAAFPTAEHGLVVLDTASGEPIDDFAVGRAVGETVFSRGGNLLAANVEGRAVVWEWEKGEEDGLILRSGDVGGANVGLSPDGTGLYTVGAHGVERWDLVGDERFIPRAEVASPAGQEALSPNGRLYARLSGGEGRIELAEIASGRIVVGAEIEHLEPTAADWYLDSSGYVAGVGERLLVLTVEGETVRIPGFEGGPVAVDVAAGGRFVAVLDGRGRVQRVDPRTRDRVTASAPRGTVPLDVALSPDGRLVFLLLARRDDAVGTTPPLSGWALVDVVEDEVLHRGPLESMDVFEPGRVEFSPTSVDRVAYFSGAGLAVLDPRTGEEVERPVAAHAGFVITGGYSGDGSRIVTAGTDGRVAVWDSDGAMLDRAVVEQRGSAIEDSFAALTPRMLDDGHTVLVMSDVAAYRWDTRIDRALDAACRMAGRSMTRLEWRTHVGDEPYRATCADRLAALRADDG